WAHRENQLMSSSRDITLFIHKDLYTRILITLHYLKTATKPSFPFNSISNSPEEGRFTVVSVNDGSSPPSLLPFAISCPVLFFRKDKSSVRVFSTFSPLIPATYQLSPDFLATTNNFPG